MAPGTLTVKCVAGYDLANQDMWPDVSDPYVVVKVGGQESQTKVINSNLNPKWDQALQFKVDIAEVKTIELQLMDQNRMKKDKPMGNLSISTESLTSTPEKKRTKLENIKKGEIEYEVSFSLDLATAAGEAKAEAVLTQEISHDLGFLADIIAWKNPVKSAFALVCTDVIFLIYFTFNFSIIGLFTSIAFFLIAGGSLYTMGQQLTPGNTPAELPEPFMLVPPQQIPYISQQIALLIAVMVKKTQYIIFWQDTNLSFKAVGGLFIVRFLSMMLGLPLLAFLGLNIAVTAPFALEKNDKFIKENIVPKTNIAKEFVEKMIAKIPKLTDAMTKED